MKIAPAVRVSAARAAVLGVTTVALLATGATMASAAPADHHRSRHFSERHNNLGEHRHHQFEHKRIEIWRGRDDDRSHDHGFCRDFNNESSSGWDDEGDFGDGSGRSCRDGVRGAGVEGHEGGHAVSGDATSADATAPAEAPAASKAAAPATTTTPAAAPATTAPTAAPSVG